MHIPRSSTPGPKSSKYHYKTSHNSTRSFTPLTFQSNIKKGSHVKIRKQPNQNIHISQTIPYTNVQIRTPFAQTKDLNLNKPLEVIQQHKNESFVLKKKNELLVAKLNDQEKQMELLKTQLQSLKSCLKQNNELYYKEANQLKSLNQQLRQKYERQVFEIDYLKNEMKSLKNQYSFNQGDNYAELYGGNTQDKNQVSRRVQYVQHYEEVVGKLSQEKKCCDKCEKTQREIQEMRLKYSNQLRSLQSHIVFLKEKELIAEVLEKQVTSKNQCIDYLRNQLEIVQTNSNHLLQVIRQLQQRIQQASYTKVTGQRPNKYYRNISSYKR